MTITDFIVILMLALLSLAVVYLYFLAFVGLLGLKFYPEILQETNFLILVPAHNEEKVIAATLRNLQKLKPVGKVEIAVIADNCTDTTAAIAKGYGVTVLERSDESHKGKGYALEWAISQYDLGRFDAVAVVDADTIAESNMLETMAQSFASVRGCAALLWVLGGAEDRPFISSAYGQYRGKCFILQSPRASGTANPASRYGHGY